MKTKVDVLKIVMALFFAVATFVTGMCIRILITSDGNSGYYGKNILFLTVSTIIGIGVLVRREHFFECYDYGQTSFVTLKFIMVILQTLNFSLGYATEHISFLNIFWTIADLMILAFLFIYDIVDGMPGFFKEYPKDLPVFAKYEISAFETYGRNVTNVLQTNISHYKYHFLPMAYLVARIKAMILDFKTRDRGTFVLYKIRKIKN